jgi:hypothetical protein
MEQRRCLSCRLRFRPRPQTPGQRYCGAEACQRERRRRWQRKRQQSDGDYRDNQRRAQQAWAARHREYWRDWRHRHPEYCERNRRQQRLRDGRRRPATLAKKDASTPDLRVPSGTYRLVPTAVTGLAKMDAWTVEIAVITAPYADAGRLRGGLQREDVIGCGRLGA